MFLEKISKLLRCPKLSRSSIFVPVLCLAGCHTVLTVKETASKPYVHNVSEFLPLESGSGDSRYTVDGTNMNYVLRTTKSGTTVKFEATSEGKVVETETYDIQDNAVRLKAAGGENFDPPVILVQFPLYVGDQTNWEGKLCCESENLKATAVVSTSTDFVQRKDKCDDAIKAEMNLQFGTGASRKLSFWFVKGKGIVRTEMSKNVREPYN